MSWARDAQPWVSWVKFQAILNEADDEAENIQPIVQMEMLRF